MSRKPEQFPIHSLFLKNLSFLIVNLADLIENFNHAILTSDNHLLDAFIKVNE